MYSSLLSVPSPAHHRKCTTNIIHDSTWLLLIQPLLSKGHSGRNKGHSFPFITSTNFLPFFFFVRGTQNRAPNSPLKNKLQSDYCALNISGDPRVLISLLKDRGIIEAISSLQIDYQVTLIHIFTQQFEF